MTLSDQSQPTPSLAAALAAEGERLSCDLIYSEKAHFAAAEWHRRTHDVLGLTAAIAAAAAAASLLKDAPLLTGALALIASIASAALTFEKPDKQAEQHLVAGRRLGALRVELRQLMQIDLGHVQDEDVRKRLGKLTARKADIDQSAPGTSQRQFEKAQKKIDSGDFDNET